MQTTPRQTEKGKVSGVPPSIKSGKRTICLEDYESMLEGEKIRQKNRLGQVITLSQSELEMIGNMQGLNSDRKQQEDATDNDTLSRARETLTMLEAMSSNEVHEKLQISAKRRADRKSNSINNRKGSGVDAKPSKF